MTQNINNLKDTNNKESRQGNGNTQAHEQKKFDDDIMKERQPYGSIKDDSFTGLTNTDNNIYDVSIQEEPDFGRGSQVRPSSASLPSEARLQFQPPINSSLHESGGGQEDTGINPSYKN